MWGATRPLKVASNACGQIVENVSEHRSFRRKNQCCSNINTIACPTGYSPQIRSDKEARTGEYMLNEKGCHKQTKVYCCPVDEKSPVCGWYNHNNGYCGPNCPQGAIEIGSTDSYCMKVGRPAQKQYQAACCSPSWTSSDSDTHQNLRLASQCSWGRYPYCDTQCSIGSMLVSSIDGSGGGNCWSFGVGTNHERPLCCDQPDDHWKYTECEWYKNIGSGSTGSNDCRSGCPDDKIQVSMSSAGCRVGSSSYCCKPVAQTLDKRSDPFVSQYRWALEAYLDNPTCPAEMSKGLGPRSLESYSMLGQ